MKIKYLEYTVGTWKSSVKESWNFLLLLLESFFESVRFLRRWFVRFLCSCFCFLEWGGRRWSSQFASYKLFRAGVYIHNIKINNSRATEQERDRERFRERKRSGDISNHVFVRIFILGQRFSSDFTLLLNFHHPKPKKIFKGYQILLLIN